MGSHRRAAVAVTALVLLAGACAGSGGPSGPLDIQVLSVSDWHGQLDPVTLPGTGEVGGAAVLASYFRKARAENPNTLVLTAGDAFGASPPLSSLYEEEPAVRAMNAMGFDADTFGNHNFDRGVGHLREMLKLSDVRYVSANLRNVRTELGDIPPFHVFDVGGVQVAVVGITNPDAPTVLRPGAMGSIRVTNPLTAARGAIDDARKQGADVVVVIAHMGLTSADPAPAGPAVDLARGLPRADVVLADHTDVQFNGVVGKTLLVENRSKGVTFAKVTLRYDPKAKKVVTRSAEFVTPKTDAVTPDAKVADILTPFREKLAAALDGKIAVATDTFPRGGNVERTKETALGNLVADAIRERYGTQVAFTNGGGLRASIPSDYKPKDTALRRPADGYAPGPPFDVVLGDAQAVLPFGNVVVTRTVTGVQLHKVLELSVSKLPDAFGGFGQISGFTFTYDGSKPSGSRVVEVKLSDGTPIASDEKTYTFATNDFTNQGGDGYTMLADGKGVSRDPLATVVGDAIRRAGTTEPKTDGRIRDVKGAA